MIGVSSASKLCPKPDTSEEPSLAWTAAGPAAHAASKADWSKVSLPASASGVLPLPTAATFTPRPSSPAEETAWRMEVRMPESEASPKSAPAWASASLCGLATFFSVTLLRTRSTVSL